MRITKEVYRTLIAQSRKDKRLSLADRWFLISLANLLDVNGWDVVHLPWRSLQKEMNLSAGSINNAIVSLKKAGYIEADLKPNTRGFESHCIRLTGIPPGPAERDGK